jgi:molecular chaperone DnaK
MPRTVGIDLGASFSLVAYVDKATGEAKCIPGPYGETLCPSIVGLDADGGIIVGAPARRRWLSQPDRGIHSVKRLMGRGVDNLPDELKKTLRVEPESRDVVRVRLGERILTPPEISAFILTELKTWAEVFLGEPVGQAVITVPAYFDEGQRRATEEAGTLAGLQVLRVVNEPAAAALAYGFHEQRRGHVAVYDLGGSGFEISILKLIPAGEGGIYHLIATRGDANLGGDDLDDALLAVAREEIRIRHGLDVGSDPQTLQILRRALVHAKHDLSFADRASLEVPLPNRSVYLRDLSRAEFEGLVQPILDGTVGPLRMALADANINPAEIDEVVLVGGSTRVPLVGRRVAEFFGRRPQSEINPDEVVALGAAVEADILEGREGSRTRWLGRAAAANVQDSVRHL